MDSNSKSSGYGDNMRYLQEKLRIEENRKGDDAEGGRDTKGHIAFGEYEMGGMAMNSDSEEDEDIFLLDEELPERIRQLLASPSTEAKKPRRKSTKEKEKEREKEKEEDAHTVKYDDGDDSDGYGALLDDDYETVRCQILTPCQVSTPTHAHGLQVNFFQDSRRLEECCGQMDTISTCVAAIKEEIKDSPLEHSVGRYDTSPFPFCRSPQTLHLPKKDKSFFAFLLIHLVLKRVLERIAIPEAMVVRKGGGIVEKKLKERKIGRAHV